MIITTHASGKMSIDREADFDLTQLIKLNKNRVSDSLQATFDTYADDGWLFETALAAGTFGSCEGYVIGAKSGIAFKVLSQHGTPTTGGYLIRAKNFFAIIYQNRVGFDMVAIGDQTGVETACWDALLPGRILMTRASKFCGAAAASWAFLDGTLFERFSSEQAFASYPTFDYGVMDASGRLIQAYGIATGTWAIDFVPSSAAGARKALCNPNRQVVQNKTLTNAEGVVVADQSMMAAVAKAIQKGTSYQTYAAYMQVYSRPTSGAYATGGMLSLALTPTKAVIDDLYEVIDGAYIIVGGKRNISAVVNTILDHNFDVDTIKAAYLSDCDYIDGQTEKLKEILTEYAGKYDELAAKASQGITEMLNASMSTCRQIIESIQNSDLSIAGFAANNSLTLNMDSVNGKIPFTVALNKVFEVNSDITKVTTQVAEAINLSKGWLLPKPIIAAEDVTACDATIASLNLASSAMADPNIDDGLKLYAQPIKLKNALKAACLAWDTEMVKRLNTINQRLTLGYIIDSGGADLPDGFAWGGPKMTCSDTHWCKDYESWRYVLGPAACSHEKDPSYDSSHIGMGRAKLYSLVTQGPTFDPTNGETTVGLRTNELAMQKVTKLNFRRSEGVDYLDLTIRTNLISALLGGNSLGPVHQISKAYLTNLLNAVFGSAIKTCAISDSAEPRYNLAGTSQPRTHGVHFWDGFLNHKGWGFGCWNHDRVATMFALEFTGFEGYQEKNGRNEDKYAWQYIPPVDYNVTLVLDSSWNPTVELPQNSYSADTLSTTLTKGIKNTLSNINSMCLQWLFNEIAKSGLLTGVKYIGKHHPGTEAAISLETLAYLTNFTLNKADAAELINQLTALRDAMDNSSPKVYVYNTTDRAYITKNLIEPLQMLSEASDSKVWFAGSAQPIAAGKDWNVAGWMTHM